MKKNHRLAGLTFLSAFVVASCGGGSDSANVVVGPAAAATTTATTNPLCSVSLLGSYYWEVGDKDGVLVSGSMGTGGVTADTAMNIASASKWPFAAYVLQKYGDVAANRPFLNFTSGYSNFSNQDCQSSDTVATCMTGGINSAEAAAATFHYQGGHMQQLAINLGHGALENSGLATEVRSGIGSDVGFTYVSPQPPGGMRTSARSYAVFLRKLLAGSTTPLQLGALLGSNAVCTTPGGTCNASQDNTFIAEPFHYSLGHWVEDNPATTPSTNFAYSSAGAFGFYPWVDVDRNLYGIVAREDINLAVRQGYASLQCGRLIRLAWKTGIAQ